MISKVIGAVIWSLLLLVLPSCGGSSAPVVEEPVTEDEVEEEGQDGGGTAGGTGGGSASGGGDMTALSYAGRAEASQDLTQRFLSETGGVPTDPYALPAGGQAVYSGYASMGLSGGGQDQTMNSDLDLVVSFGENTVSGTMSDFRRNDDVPLPGTLYIRNGVVDQTAGYGSGEVVRAEVEGVLTSGAGPLSFDADLAGEFYSDNADHLRGTISGPVSSTTGTLQASGEFGASR